MDTFFNGGGLKKSGINREVEIPINKREDTLSCTVYGPGNYASIQRKILNSGKKTLTIAETSFLVNSAMNHPEHESFKKITRLLKNNWLWGFTGILYYPHEGVYFQDYPEIKDFKVVMERNSLLKSLESGDRRVRFVPLGFKDGYQSPSELSKNKYIMALVGREGAEVIGDISGRYKMKSLLRSYKSPERPMIKVASITAGWLGTHFEIDGTCTGECRKAKALGCKKSA